MDVNLGGYVSGCLVRGGGLGGVEELGLGVGVGGVFVGLLVVLVWGG